MATWEEIEPGVRFRTIIGIDRVKVGSKGVVLKKSPYREVFTARVFHAGIHAFLPSEVEIIREGANDA